MTTLRLLEKGCSGDDVLAWELFLVGQGQTLLVDGRFDEDTHKATIAFQRSEDIRPFDGRVGNRTLAAAMQLGFEPFHPDLGVTKNRSSAAWPPAPSALKPFIGAAGERAREKLFGAFEYKHTPTKSEPEKITIDPAWVRDNIVELETPQLSAANIRRNTRLGAKVEVIRVHRLAAPVFQKLFDVWQERSLLCHLFTLDGAFYPRFIRGSTTRFSNHAFGTALDFNEEWNRLGARPALNEPGSVRDLVPAANKLGVYWGGHYKGRPDGMHFEVVEL